MSWGVKVTKNTNHHANNMQGAEGWEDAPIEKTMKIM